MGKATSSASYERMPIEAFGKNLLSKLGWTEGAGIGRNPNALNAIAQPIEYVPRQRGLGLGAKALSRDQIKKIGDDDLRKKLTVTKDYETTGVGKNFKGIDEQLKEREVMKVGSQVYIVNGTHKNLAGKIVAMSADPKADIKRQQQIMGEKVSTEIDAEAYVMVELTINDTTVGIKRKNLILQSEKDKMNSSYRKKSRSRSKESRSNKRDNNEKKKKLKWVLPGIIVRVISKKIEGGKLYNKKMKVTDVHNQYQFTLVPIEDNNMSRSLIVYDNIREKYLETVLPKDKDQEVVILRGEFRGETGKILSKDKKKDEVLVQVGLVDIIKLSQDDLCAKYDE